MSAHQFPWIVWCVSGLIGRTQQMNVCVCVCVPSTSGRVVSVPFVAHLVLIESVVSLIKSS